MPVAQVWPRTDARAMHVPCGAPGSRGGDAGQGEEGIELVALPQRMGGEVEEEEVLAAIEARVDALRTDRTPARAEDAAAHQSEGEAAAPAPAE